MAELDYQKIHISREESSYEIRSSRSWDVLNGDVEPEDIKVVEVDIEDSVIDQENIW